MNNGTIEQIDPLGWVEVERATSQEKEVKLTINFELRGYPCSIEFQEGFDKLLARLPGMMQRLTREGAIPPPKKFVGSEGTDLPQSGSRVPLSVLTKQERRVLIAMANGASYYEMAKDMEVSEKTVSTYVSRLKLRLGLRDRVNILWYAAENGLFKDGKAYEPPKRGRKPKGAE